MSKFEIFNGKNTEFYFRLKAGNGEIILASEGYTTKASCKNGIDSVRKNAPIDGHYTRFNNRLNQPTFNLKAANHEIIGVGEAYSGVQARETGIESVKRNAPVADITDLTS